MDSSALIELTYRMLVIVLMLSLPVVIASVLVGLIVGILQAVTQIQDQSIAYGVKLVVGIGVIALTAAWSGSELVAYARQIFESIGSLR
jgi:type III secretion protein S